MHDPAPHLDQPLDQPLDHGEAMGGRFGKNRARSKIYEIFGWETWIRTKINGVRVRCSTVELSPTRLAAASSPQQVGLT